MKKKTKILISILAVMTAALTAGSFWAGNYLVDYALYRADQAPQSANDGKAPVNETYGNEEANKAEEQRLTDLWLDTVVLEKKEIVSEDGLTLRALQYTADPASIATLWSFTATLPTKRRCDGSPAFFRAGLHGHHPG